MTSTTPTVLIVPGLRDHVPEHWQTLLAAKLPRVVSVAPLEQEKLSCAARVDAIDRARDLAQAWGSRFVELGEVGHLNPASGHGEWPRAEELIRELS